MRFRDCVSTTRQKIVQLYRPARRVSEATQIEGWWVSHVFCRARAFCPFVRFGLRDNFSLVSCCEYQHVLRFWRKPWRRISVDRLAGERSGNFSENSRKSMGKITSSDVQLRLLLSSCAYINQSNYNAKSSQFIFQCTTSLFLKIHFCLPSKNNKK